jgi:DNA-binding transcriptional LysR family regulator
MDLWQLKIFCKVVELKSFSRAGKSVHLSQPTVSSHIMDLEDHFGCRLIDRLSKEAVATKAGELLYGYARKILAFSDETEAAMAEFNGKIKGRLLIGGSTIPGTYLLPRIIGAFTEQYPEVTISLMVADTEKIIDGVLSGNLEMGVVGAESSEKNIFQEKLIEDELRLIVPENHPWARRKEIHLNLLLSEPFIVRENGSGTLATIQLSLASEGYTIEDLKIAAELGSTEAVRQGIKNKVGVSILSTLAVSEDLKIGSLKAIAVKGLKLKRSFYLTRHKHRSLSPLSRVFIEFLKKERDANHQRPIDIL